MRKIFAGILALGIVGCLPSARAADGWGLAQSATPVPPATAGTTIDLSAVPQLQQRIAIRGSYLSLEDLLSKVSQGHGVTLRVTDLTIRYQRITLDLADIKLSQLMENLLFVLSHGEPNSPHPQYYWYRIPNLDARKPPIYELRVGFAAKESLQRELDRPRREALQYLKDMRDEVNLPAEQRLQHPHIMPDVYLPILDQDPNALAVAGLSNDDLTQLLAGQHLFIHSTRIDAAEEHRYSEMILAARQRGDERPYPPYQKYTDDLYTLIMSDSYNMDDPGHNQVFMMNVARGKVMDYISGGNHIGGDDLDVVHGIGLLPAKADPKAVVYDLTPLFQEPTVTDSQRHDAGFVLAAIARTAHLHIVAEQFLRPPLNQNGLHHTQGTLVELINDFCKVWNMRVTKVGDEYFFRDRDWGRMRQADIPDVELAAIRKHIDSQNGDLTDWDRLNLCARYSWLQTALTLSYAIPEFGKAHGYRAYLSQHIVGLMTLEERTAATKPGGIALAQLSPTVRTAITTELDYSRYLGQYHPELAEKFTDSVLQASHIRLHPTERSDAELPFQPESLSVVSATGDDLWNVTIAR